MTIKELIKAKEAKASELRSAIITAETLEVRQEIGATLLALEEEIAALKEIDDNEPAPVEGASEGRMSVVAASTSVQENTVEARAKKFAETGRTSIEARSVLVSSGNLATPTEVAGINDAPNAVSSIVDLVKVTDCSGMGAYKVAYMKSIGAAGTQEEGAAIAESEPVFDFVEIKPTTKAILSYISAQAKKQSPLQYEAKVNDAAKKALRKAAAGIVTAAIVASDLCDTVEITGGIDAGTLRKIALAYGGENDVEGNATLFLNKADLVAFGDVRGDNEKGAIYEITPDAANPNTGVIKEGGLAVKYCIDNDLAAGTVLYGNGHNCELALFGDYEVKVSEDFAFNKNMDAIRGTVDLGADVVAQGGFVKATITA